MDYVVNSKSCYGYVLCHFTAISVQCVYVVY